METVSPLEEAITPVADALSGSVIYKSGDYFEFRDSFTVMEYDAASGAQSVLFQKIGADFHISSFFDMSRDRGYFAHWLDESWDEKYLIVYDSAGTEVANYQLLYRGDPVLDGKDLLSPPQFSPQNPELLLYRYSDRSDDRRLKLGVLNWRTGEYALIKSGSYSSVAWQEDGAIVASAGNEIYRLEYRNGQFGEPIKLFSTPNNARYIDISKDQTKMVFTMSGRIFWCNMDGSNLTQVTAPPSTGSEFAPKWSPDGMNIMFYKDDDRYIISAATRNARIYRDEDKNVSKTRYLSVEGGSVRSWIP